MKRFTLPPAAILAILTFLGLGVIAQPTNLPAVKASAVMVDTNGVLSAPINFFDINAAAFARGITNAAMVIRVPTVDLLPVGGATNGGGLALVEGIAKSGDWGMAKLFRWDGTNSHATNAVIRGNPAGVGRWVHDWDGDAQTFGVTGSFIRAQSDTPTLTLSDSRAALQSAIDYMHELGGGWIRLPDGTIQLTWSVFMRPRVCLIGAGGAANGFSGRWERNMGITYLETVTTNGFGVPPLVFDGPTYFTNEFTQTFINEDGDTIGYYSGQNTIQDIAFTTYQVGAGGTNKYPVAGVVINQVGGITVQRCSFVNVRGYGIWAVGPRGLRVLDSAFVNCVTAAWFVSYASDTSYHRNLVGGSGVLFYRANTPTLHGNEIWNPYWSSIDYLSTATVNSYGLNRPFNTYDTQIASAASNTVYQTTGDWKADTGTMVKFVGSSPPTPFIIDKPYFLINGPDARVMKIAKSPSDAMAGVAMDITSDATSGTWRLTGWTEAVYARECQEVTIGNQRSEQSYQRTILLDGCTRGDIFGSKIWEIGTHQGPHRANAFTGDKLFAGVYLMNCDAIDVVGNKFQGGYNFAPHVNNITGEYFGVYATNCSDVNFIGNSLLSLKAGVYAGPGCFNVRAYGNSPGGDVLRVADSINTSGANDLVWSGINQNGTNPVVSSEIPAGLTNLTDFSLYLNFMPSTPQVSGSGDSYDPIIHIGPSTNYSGSAYLSLPGTLRTTLFKGSGQTNWSLFIDLVGASNSFLRAIMPVYDQIDTGHPFGGVTITRSGSTWGMMRAGYWTLIAFITTNGPTPPAYNAPIHAKHAILGYWPTELFRNGWFSEVVLLNRGSTSYEARDMRSRALGTNAVFAWDFKGDFLNLVRDKSGNGIHGTVVNLSPSIPHAWGPWIEYNPSPLLTAATVVSNTLNAAKREALSGEAPGLLFRGGGYVTANNLPVLGTNDFTFWTRFVMPSGTNNALTPWCLSAATNSGNTARTVYLQCLTNGNVEVLLTGATSSDGIKAIASGARTRHAGQVVDVIFSRSNGTPFISINGTNEVLTAGSFGSPPTWGSTINSSNVIVGTGAQAFRGRIFRAAAWNRALTGADIAALFAGGIADADRWTTPTGAGGAFIDLNLGVGTGVSIPDRSTNAYNGTLIGTAEHVLKN